MIPLPRRRQALAAALATGLLWLAGCASTPPARPPAANGPWSGRLSLRVDSTPPQYYSAGFELRGDARAGELKIASPFGQTLASADWQAGVARLRRGSDERLYPDLDSLTTDLTGTALPIAALFDWLQGRATSVEGWTVDLSDSAAGRLRAERLSPAPTATLRLVMP